MTAETTTALEPDACWSLLRRADVGRLGVVVEGRPEIFPINYVVDHGTLVFRTAPGAKLDAVFASPAVAVEADGYDAGSQQAWSVVVKGRAEAIQAMHEVIDSTALPLFPWQGSPKRAFIRVVPVEVTGRLFRRVDPAFWATPLSGVRPVRPE